MKVNHNSHPQISLYNYNITTNAKSSIPEADDGFLYAEPEQQQQYFDIRAPFDPIKLLKSPMGMMIGMTVLMMWCMKNMPDAEELRKEQAAQR